MTTVPSYFSQAFQGVYGRPATEEDYNNFVNERINAREESLYGRKPTNKELIGQIGGAAAGLGGMLLGSKVPGWIAGTAATGATAGGTAAATAAPTAAAIAAPTTVTGTGISAGLSSMALPAAAIAIGSKAIYDGTKRAKKEWDSGDEGKAITRGLNTLGNPISGFTKSDTVQKILAALSPAAPLLALGLYGNDIWGSDKDKYQMSRDDIRSKMQDLNILDENYNLNNVDLGQDGDFKFKDGRRIYEVIPGMEDGAMIEDEKISQAVGNLNPLGFLLSGGNDDTQGYATGMLYNALAGGDVNNEVDLDQIRGLYDKAGLDQKTAFEGINLLHQSGELSTEEALAAQNAINTVFGQEYYSPTNPDEYAQLVSKTREKLFS